MVNSYLLAGYAAVWTLIFIYLVFLQRRQQRLNKELKSLQETLVGVEGENQATARRPEPKAGHTEPQSGMPG